MKIEGKEYRTIWFEKKNKVVKNNRPNKTSSQIYH